ncbi:MAG TPA: tetratricopeptide repeat protein [Saprospiraceae bacterium]|nr:tetratricopeptide repeat protein [Saprospiraceae bacterium]HPI07668.1 tetratricopeptide repeat protein [Saprospiraceae bacterium]
MSKRLEQLTTLLESAPNDAFLLFALAKEHETLHNAPEALAFYLRLLKTDPGYVGLYYHLGKLYEQQQDFDNAIQTYKQGIEVSKKAGDRHAMSELNGALLNLEDPE